MVYGGLAQDNEGLLYATTYYGGQADIDGTGYAVLHRFSGIPGDGTQPLAPLLFGSDGALYGSTYWGGRYSTNGVSGTLFRLFSQPAIVITSITPGPAGYLISFAGGAAAVTYEIEATTNNSIGGWQTIGSSTAAIDGAFQFLDSTATNVPSRFYRSVCR